MLIRLLVLTTLLLPGTNLLAQVPPSLVGTWVALPDSSGLVFPHLEELRIARDGSVVTTVYGVRRFPNCDDAASALTGPCAVGRTDAKGHLVVDHAEQTIALESMTLEPHPMAGVGRPDDERLSRDIFWFGPGEAWNFSREGEALVMSRQSRPFVPNSSLDGTKVFTITKLYFPVDDDFAGDAVGLAEAGGFSVAKLLCIMPFSANSGGGNRVFRKLVHDIAIVERRQEELRAHAVANRNAESAEKLRKTLATLYPSTDPPSTAEVAAAAAELRVEPAQVAQFVRELSLRLRASKPGAELPFSVLKAHEAQIRACQDHYFK